ncbi:DUF4326 domain-containing protein [Nocardioides sp. PD653]|uniref:DUF4326 domain-containing protein n=1 Tax=Nocardioides sp. PD653 TaxID=393303 RepID=UPI0009F0B7A2|nr:DUF4326 domain-containing protein [Nocardioides sp. PD653]GAW54714.1 Gp57 [Nocardioides sp. PD653]
MNNVPANVAPRRVQRRRTAGWRMPDGAVYVGRPTVFGNPAVIERGRALGDRGRWLVWAGDVGPLIASVSSEAEARAEAVAFFRRWLGSPSGVVERSTTTGAADLSWAYSASHERLRARLADLRGHDLACWCPLDQPCHADVLLELANQEDR